MKLFEFRMLITQILLVFAVTSLLSCRQMMSSIVGTTLAPMSSKELWDLQFGLFGYRLVKAAWPDNVNDYRQYSDSLQQPVSDLFEEISLLKHNDSLDIKYLLRYPKTDSTEIRLIEGIFMITLGSDSSMQVVHKLERVERFDGVDLSSGSSDAQQVMKSKVERLNGNQKID